MIGAKQFKIMKKTAVISKCGNYRYSLERTWDDTKPKVMFIMLNPSTADASIDDPTIRRCISFAKGWGYGSLLVGNLFAYRSTNPKELLSVSDPVGKENISHLNLMREQSKTVVCAFGNSKIIKKIQKNYVDNSYKPLSGFGDLYYIDLCNDGTPKHPLYLKSDLELKLI